MGQNKKNIWYVSSVATVFFLMAIAAWTKPSEEFSAAERRKLEQFPTVSAETIKTGSFMADFEDYALDQFPFRETFRGLKAVVSKYVMGKKDNNGIYLVEGYIGEMDTELNEKALKNAVKKFDYLYENCMAGTDVSIYFSIIPDKNAFLAKQAGCPSLDYDALYDRMQEELDYMTYIEIRDLLTIEDYYRTDTHWRQECIGDVAGRLAEQMGVSLEAEYEKKEVETPFYGVYYGQLGLPVSPDTIFYLDNDMFEQCTVIDYENNREIPIYNLEMAKGRDPYELFLSGSLSVITIENPYAATDKELIIFRDSFGSSLTPLLVEGYSKITMLDIRYLHQSLVEKLVTFTNQDVLFLYNASVLNNETAFK